MPKLRRGNIDNNHKEIVEALRSVGCSVVSLASVGDGCPDLLVGIFGTNLLFEVKNPEARGKLMKSQDHFIQTWQGRVFVVESKEEAIEVALAAATKHKSP